jgi:hypothetical protein
VPAVSLLLVFILLFFSWVGLYPGGVPALTQSAWGAAFGAYSLEIGMEPLVLPALDKEKPDNAIPGVSVATIFYLLLFFPALALTVAVLVQELHPFKLPPQLDQVMPWRWGIVAATNLLVFFFLALQLLLGFSVESKYTAWVDSQPQVKDAKTPTEQKQAEAYRGEMLERLHRTIWLKLAVVLHILAILCAVLMYLLGQRGDRRPLPRMELLW